MKEFNEIIEKIGGNEDFFFVQIGSNDGVRSDPLYKFICKYNWSGILVEPVPYLYERLIKNHESRDNLIFKNVAISKDGGSMKFYYIKENQNDQSDWKCGNGLGSFLKDVVTFHRNKIFDFDKNFSEMDIQTITFDSLVEGVNNIDLLAIDAEGYDYEIIKSIDFDKHQPSLILFEHKHLYQESRFKRNLSDKLREVYKYLNDRGYVCIKGKGETLAIHDNLNSDNLKQEI